MSNESVSLKTPETSYTAASSGNFKEDFQSSAFSAIGSRPWNMLTKATATLLFIGSLNTVTFSNSYFPNQQEETSTVLKIQKPIPGKKISISEARKITRDIMKQAEKRHFEFIQKESQGIPIWEETE